MNKNKICNLKYKQKIILKFVNKLKYSILNLKKINFPNY